MKYYKILNKFRILLLPLNIFVFIYLKIKNFLYDYNFLKSLSYKIPIISIGNIKIGGTGKTPLIDLLLHKFEFTNNVAIISKGYKRKTKGLILIHESYDSNEVGDEAFFLFKKHPNFNHIVCNNKSEAINYAINNINELNYIILDDAFHHREINFFKNVLLIDFNNPLNKDFLLPAGNLRELQKDSNRADIIIITKCNLNLTIKEANNYLIKTKLKYSNKNIFFTYIEYGRIKKLFSDEYLEINNLIKPKVILIHGIAQPEYLLEYLSKKFEIVENLDYPDHAKYNINNIYSLLKIYNKNKNCIIITTEKDAIKLVKFKELLNETSIYILPIKINFLFNSEDVFFEKLLN